MKARAHEVTGAYLVRIRVTARTTLHVIRRLVFAFVKEAGWERIAMNHVLLALLARTALRHVLTVCMQLDPAITSLGSALANQDTQDSLVARHAL